MPVMSQSRFNATALLSDKTPKSSFFFLSTSQKKRPHTGRCLNVEEKIQINKEVSNIDWSRSADESVTVKCSDGSTYNADHVIVSVPLGVLKHNYTTLFTPQLPKIKKNAIQGISFGTVGKIYLEFEKPWWPSDWVGLSLLWTKEDIEKIKSTENYWFVMLMKMLAGRKVLKSFLLCNLPRKGWSRFLDSIR